MNDTQQDITADLTDERLLLAAARDYRNRSSGMSRREARYRAVARLAREGWRPIRSNPLPVAEGEPQELSQQLHELVAVLESLQIPRWPGRVLRAAELLGKQQALAPVLAPAADREVQELAAWLNNHASHLCCMEEIGALSETELVPQLTRAAELLQQQTFQPVPASERPWECEGWLHPHGLWCWQWRPDSASWQMTTCGFSFAPSDDSLLLPYWAIIDPESTNTAS